MGPLLAQQNHEPSRKGPYPVILITPTAIEVAGSGGWGLDLPLLSKSGHDQPKERRKMESNGKSPAALKGAFHPHLRLRLTLMLGIFTDIVYA